MSQHLRKGLAQKGLSLPVKGRNLGAPKRVRRSGQKDWARHRGDEGPGGEQFGAWLSGQLGAWGRHGAISARLPRCWTSATTSCPSCPPTCLKPWRSCTCRTTASATWALKPSSARLACVPFSSGALREAGWVQVGKRGPWWTVGDPSRPRGEIRMVVALSPCTCPHTHLLVQGQQASHDQHCTRGLPGPPAPPCGGHNG